MADHQRFLVWLSSQILPHEADVRAWLSRALNNSADVEDVVQEAYCRLSALTDIDGIENPRAYFFKIARNVVIDEIRRSKVVRIETRSEIEDFYGAVEEVTPERVVSARRELKQVQKILDLLPPRAREVFVMRKVEGLSQKEIARRLGISEHMVENEAARGLKRILKIMEEGPVNPKGGQLNASSGRQRGQLGNK